MGVLVEDLAAVSQPVCFHTIPTKNVTGEFKYDEKK